jgi:hypothetical protein
MSSYESERIACYGNQPSNNVIYDSSPACLLECYLEVVPPKSNPSGSTKTVTRTAGESPDRFIAGSRADDFLGVKTRTDASKEVPDRSLLTFMRI